MQQFLVHWGVYAGRFSIVLWSLFLVVAQLLSAAALGREYPAFYERDYETARKLNDIYEKLEAAESLFMLDSASDAIIAGACRDEDQAYQRAYDALSQLGRKLSSAGSLSVPEQQRYRQLQQTSDQNWQRFEACFDEQVRRPVFANSLPPGVSSYATAIATYDRFLAEHPGEFTEGQVNRDVARLEAEIEGIEAERAYIARVIRVFRNPQVSRTGKAGPVRLQVGDELLAGDVLLTGSRSKVTFEFYDRIEEKDAGPTVVTVFADSEVRMAAFRFDRWQEAQRRAELERSAALDAVRGTVRAFTKGFGGRAAFSIRTGTSLCGIRGTDVEVFYDPVADLVDYKLYEGVVEIRAPARTLNLKAGNSLRVREGVPADPKPLAEIVPPAA